MTSPAKIVATVEWVETDPGGPLPGHHWQASVHIGDERKLCLRCHTQAVALQEIQVEVDHLAEVAVELEKCKVIHSEFGPACAPHGLVECPYCVVEEGGIGVCKEP